MWGESAEMTLTSDMKIESLKLLRMVAKINVVVADAMAPKFKMKEILLYNYRKGGYLVPDRDNLKAGSTTLVEEPTPLGSRIEFPTDPVSYTEIEDDKSCTNYIYTFETEQPKTAGDAPDFDKMHALVIGAEFDGNSLSYYRVNFNKTVDNVTTFLDLLRNHRYEIKIVEVKGNGYGTPEEAFNSKGLNIGTEIIEWDDSEMGEIVYNGQYTLSVSKGEWSFSYDQLTAAAETNKLKVETNFPSGWKADKYVDEN